MKFNAPVNDSLVALKNHISYIYLQPDDINILCGEVIDIRMIYFFKCTNHLHHNQFDFRSKLGKINALLSVVGSKR